MTNSAWPFELDKDQRKEIIEELKIVQDILLKQEAYSHSAFNYSFVITAGLVLAYFGDRTSLSPSHFVGASWLISLCFLYVQATYRESLLNGLKRSHYLQRLLGGRRTSADEEYKAFEIYENLHHPIAKWSSFNNDILNARFSVPNVALLLLPLIAVWAK